MNHDDEQKTTAGAPAPEEPTTGTPPKTTQSSTGGKTVTSARDIDFPSLGWAIRAGETKALPEDKDAAAAILSNYNISLTK